MSSEADDKPTLIYCVEGHWHAADDPTKEPSVEPLLQMLDRLGLWNNVRRNAATDDELFYWMRNEWYKCAEGSILYFATHGGEGEVWLGSDEQHYSSVPLEKLSEIDCSGCLVHFSGCSTLACDENRVQFFLEKSGASAVSGYRGDVGWTSRRFPPAALLDLMLFSVIADEGINVKDLNSGNVQRDLLNLRKGLQMKFPECGFDLHLPS